MKSKKSRKEPDKEYIHCLCGLFTGCEIICEDGEYPAITYKIIWEQAKDKKGFYNIIWDSDINRWIIFQYVLIGE